MLQKERNQLEFVSIKELVEDLYCPDNGRPSIDPVVLFKIILIHHIFGILSLHSQNSRKSKSKRRIFQLSAINLQYKSLILFHLI